MANANARRSVCRISQRPTANGKRHNNKKILTDSATPPILKSQITSSSSTQNSQFTRGRRLVPRALPLRLQFPSGGPVACRSPSPSPSDSAFWNDKLSNHITYYPHPDPDPQWPMGASQDHALPTPRPAWRACTRTDLPPTWSSGRQGAVESTHGQRPARHARKRETGEATD
eukprot:scaffold26753_cov27-Tisochrysis_lutea.AAC.1